MTLIRDCKYSIVAQIWYLANHTYQLKIQRTVNVLVMDLGFEVVLVQEACGIWEADSGEGDTEEDGEC